MPKSSKVYYHFIKSSVIKITIAQYCPLTLYNVCSSISSLSLLDMYSVMGTKYLSCLISVVSRILVKFI
jgi:hypothetical protein